MGEEILNLLKKLWRKARPRPVVKGKLFRDQEVLLDGKTWVGCTFYNCRIVLRGGEFDAISCNYDICQLVVRRGAACVISIAKVFYPQIPINTKEPLDLEEHK